MRIFILFACAIAVYFGGRLALELSRYAALSSSAPAQVTRWDIEEEGSRFAIRAAYTFAVKEKILVSSSRLSEDLFLNESVALTSLREKAKQNWTVYYNAKRPETSALDRTFPTGLAIRCLIATLVAGYFFVLRRRASV